MVDQPSPRSIAGKSNRAKRRGLTPDGRERLRQAALAKKPWIHSTGPRTPAGKSQSALNGKRRQLGVFSVRELRRELSEYQKMTQEMAGTRAVVNSL